MTTKSLPREAVLIVNIQSRNGDAFIKEGEAKLKEAGVKLLAVHAVKDPERMSNIVRQAVCDRAPMVIVGGGDGSLASTVDELIGSGCVFGVLPLGTANSFARSLGLPLNLDGAVEVIANGRRRRIDLGMINDDYFVNGAAMGLSPLIGQTVPPALKRYLGRIGYLCWAAKCSISFRPFELIIDDGSGEQRMWSTEVRVLNGSHHGGVELSDNADIDSGELLIQAVVGRSRVNLAWDWYAKLLKLRDRDTRTQDFSGRSFRISARPRQPISIDGEVLACTPVRATVAPGAIEVAVPIAPGE